MTKYIYDIYGNFRIETIETFISVTPSTDISLFSQQQMREMNQQNIEACNITYINKLTNTQVSWLRTETNFNQISWFKPEIMKYLTILQYFSKIQLQALAPAQVIALTDDQINSNIIKNKFNPNIFTTASYPIEIALLTSSQIQALTSTQIINLLYTQIQALRPLQIQALTSTQIPNLNITNLKYSTSYNILNNLLSSQIPALTEQQIWHSTYLLKERLNNTFLHMLSTTQVQNLSSNFLNNLSQSQVQSLSSDFLNKLSIKQFFCYDWYFGSTLTLTWANIYGFNNPNSEIPFSFINKLTSSQIQNLSIINSPTYTPSTPCVAYQNQTFSTAALKYNKIGL
jgi:hypothetical protein